MLFVCPFPREVHPCGWSHYFGIMYVPGIQCGWEQEKLSSHASPLPWSPAHGTVRCSQGLPSSSYFGTWVSAAGIHNGFWAWLASKNGKKLNYSRDHKEQGQGSFRAVGEEEDASSVGWNQWCGLQPQTWHVEILHNEKQISHWHSGLQ